MANTVKITGREWCPIHDRIEPCQRCAEAEAIARCGCGGADVIDRLTTQLHTAIRLGMEGQKTSLKLLLNQQARRYPALRELSAKYTEPSDILRAAKGDDGP
jgi:hypothetical protein